MGRNRSLSLGYFPLRILNDHFVLLLFSIPAYNRGFNDTGLNRGFTARPDCAVHRPCPLGPRFSQGLLAYSPHRSHVLVPVWLRSPYRSFPVDPLSCYVFGEIVFGGMPSLRT